jgi:hypothetical protein
MMQVLLISLVLLAIGMALLLVKVLIRKNGTFSSQHIHDSEAMRERGIHCVMDQDREMRSRKRLVIED